MKEMERRIKECKELTEMILKEESAPLDLKVAAVGVQVAIAGMELELLRWKMGELDE